MSKTPQRQIRALYTSDTITVYQAYNSTIASAAVAHQKLNASSSFSISRMTWIKPSWCWMMYRSGYSFKDPNQTNILAITMKIDNFIQLMRHARLASDGSARVTGAKVIVQWDPERGPRLEKFDHRSIQIGISREICDVWIDQWIEGIEDVTERARAMKSLLDDDPNAGVEELQKQGLMPVEKVFDGLPEDVLKNLGMVGEDEQEHFVKT